MSPTLNDATFKLGTPTIFNQLNRSKNYEEDTVTSEIRLNQLKYKHIREMVSIELKDQMTYLMQVITGLDTADLDELQADDAAALIEIIFNRMGKFTAISKNFLADFTQHSATQMTT